MSWSTKGSWFHIIWLHNAVMIASYDFTGQLLLVVIWGSISFFSLLQISSAVMIPTFFWNWIVINSITSHLRSFERLVLGTSFLKWDKIDETRLVKQNLFLGNFSDGLVGAAGCSRLWSLWSGCGPILQAMSSSMWIPLQLDGPLNCYR